MALLQRALAGAIDEIAAFLTDPSRRILHVHADPRLREPLLEATSSVGETLRASLELHEVSSVVRGGRDWHRGATELAAQHLLGLEEERRRPFPGPASAPGSGLEAFARVLGHVAAVARSEQKRLVVAVAPVRAATGEWAAELDLLVRSPAASSVSWLVIETADATFASRVGPAERCDVRITPEQERAEIVQRLRSAGDRQTPVGLASSALAEAHELARGIQRAAGLFLGGEPLEAVRAQSAVCAAVREPRARMEHDTLLASYVAAAGDPTRALVLLADVAERARQDGAVDAELTALLASAGITLGASGPERGAAAYEEVGRRASALGRNATAFDLFRAAAELHHAARQDARAASAMREALAMAERVGALAPSEATAAGRVASRLAELCEANRLGREAERWRAVARDLAPRAVARDLEPRASARRRTRP